MSSQLSAIELLKLGNEGREKPLLNKIWPQVIGVVLGVGLGSAINFTTRRPLLSGFQKHIFSAVLLTGALTLAQNKRDEYYAEKDAVLRHYVELHPEDFPEPERRKIGDLFENWLPIR